LAPIQRIDTMTVSPASVAFVIVPGARLLRLVDNSTGQPSPAGPAVAPTLSLALHYDALVDTTVALSVSGGTAGTVTVPASVAVPRGSVSPAQPVPVTVANPGPGTQTYTITATLTLPSGESTSNSASITVTGLLPPGPILTGPPGPILTGPILTGTIVNPGTIINPGTIAIPGTIAAPGTIAIPGTIAAPGTIG
ncbi:MAG: hypothetical protein ACREFH_02625, partial [Stellaceae bacterium]